MTLRDLDRTDQAVIELIDSDGSEVQDGFKMRLEALGLVPGKRLLVLRSAAFGGPLHVRVGSTTEVAIRRSEALRVRVLQHRRGAGRTPRGGHRQGHDGDAQGAWHGHQGAGRGEHG